MLTATDNRPTTSDATDVSLDGARDQTFFETFLKPAHPYRWGTEPVSIPREQESLFKANSDIEIDMGVKRVAGILQAVGKMCEGSTISESAIECSISTLPFCRLQLPRR